MGYAEHITLNGYFRPALTRYVLIGGSLIAQYLFHPHDGIPSVELATAFMERSDTRVSDALVKQYAITRQIGIMFIIGVRDACIQVRYTEFPQERFKMTVQLATESLPTHIFAQINGHLDTMVICTPRFERSCVSISGNNPIAIQYEPGMALERMRYSSFEFSRIRRFQLE